jgi:hypothetical protein
MENEKQKTIAEEVINRLDEQDIKPIARWHFVFRNSSFWTLWGLSIVLGACATAATIFVFLNSGWQYQSVTHDSFLKFLLDIVPFFWIVSIFGMIAFGYFNIRHTTRGYRFSFYMVVLLSILISFIGGTILYAIGVGRNIDNIRRPIPFASPILFTEEGRWNNTEKGLISGSVESFDSINQTLTINLFSGEKKILSTKELQEKDLNLLTGGAHIRIIGGFDEDDKDTFVACVVIPWDISGVSHKPIPKYLPPKIIGERKEDKERISVCKDVRPYQRYKQTLITN